MLKPIFLFVFLVYGFLSNAQHNHIYLIEAEAVLKQADTSRAISYFKSILENDPQYFPAALRLAEINYDKKVWSNAALYANIALDILFEEEKKITEIDYAQYNKDTIESLSDYYQYQKLKADIASVLHLRAKTRMKQENYYSAIADLDTAYGYTPHNADLQVDYGISNFELGDIPEALNRFYLALDIDPDNYKAFYNLGILYLSKKDTLQAVEYIKKSIKRNPTFFGAMLDLGSLYMEKGHYNDAIEVYNQVLNHNNASVEALFRRGYAHSRLDNHTAALNDWENVYQLDSSQVEAVRNAGLTRLASKDYEGAIKDFDKYINRLPGLSIGYLNRGYALLLNGQYQNAINDFRKVIELDPKNSSGYYYEGLVFAVMGKKKKACNLLQEAVARGYKQENADEIFKKICN